MAMEIVEQAFGKLPVNLGDYDELVAQGRTSFGITNRVFRYGCELESLTDNNTFEPITWDGAETFVIDTVHWKLVSGNPKVWAAGNPKPASTGTSGDYPYNGMGRVVLEKNMQNIAGAGEPENIVCLLTQDMFYKGPAGSRVPNENTIYIIQYDFVLDSDITIPANCVLDFQGGSISGANLLGTLLNSHVNVENFKPRTSNNISEALQNCINICKNVIIPSGTFVVSQSITLPSGKSLFGTYKETVITFTSTNGDNGINITGNKNTIEGISFVGSGYNAGKAQYLLYKAQQTTDLIVSRCSFSTATGGILVDNRCSDIHISECVFDDMSYVPELSAGGYGIVLQHIVSSEHIGPKRVYIHNNIFKDGVYRHAIYVQSCEDVFIHDNSFYDTLEMKTATYEFRIVTVSSKKVNIHNNSVYGGVGFLYVRNEGTMGTSSQIIVSNNNIKDCYLNYQNSSGVITLIGTENAAIADNTFIDCGISIKIDSINNVTISGNVHKCRRETSKFILAANDNRIYKEILILNNNVDYVDGYGVQLSGVSSYIDISFIGNIIKSSTNDAISFIVSYGNINGDIILTSNSCNGQMLFYQANVDNLTNIIVCNNIATSLPDVPVSVTNKVIANNIDL